MKLKNTFVKTQNLTFSLPKHYFQTLKKICALAGINEVVSEGDRTLPKSSW